jgi:hypothetical protein
MHDSGQISRAGHRLLVGRCSVVFQSGVPLVLALGIIGQLVDSRTYPSYAVGTQLHALFGLLLCAAIFTHFHKRMQHAPLATPGDIAAFSRGLSRRIYLLMYVLLGLRIAMGLDRPIMGLDRPRLLPAEGFRDYLICGVVALVLIRALAARWQRTTRFMPLASQPRAESP